MNYYQHHIGDFDKATRHLTRIERSIYRDLIELYYDTEQPLTLDLAALCRKIIARSNEEVTAVEQALNEFFTKTPTGWFHSRCDEEIERYMASNGQKSLAGKASAAKRALKRQQALNGNSTAVEQTLNGAPTNQEPLTNNQDINNHVADSGESSADENKKPKFTDADRELAIHMLAAVQKISPSMKAAKSWPDDIRLMRERDNHTLDEIREMFDWANADPFWSANILSPGKLRDKWAQLEAQRNRPKLAVVNGKQSAHGGFEHIDYSKGVNADGSF